MRLSDNLAATFQTLRRSVASWRLIRGIETANPHVVIERPTVWKYDDLSAIVLGQQVSFGPFCEIIIYARDPHSAVAGRLNVGNCSVVGAFANIRAAGGAIEIGHDCLIGQHVSLIASNHQIRSDRPYWQQQWNEAKTGVRIGNNVWLGCGVTVLPGVAVGDNAVVGAGAIVTKNVPAGTIWVGNPARQVRSIA